MEALLLINYIIENKGFNLSGTITAINLIIITKNAFLLSEMYYQGKYNEHKNVKSGFGWFDFIC